MIYETFTPSDLASMPEHSGLVLRLIPSEDGYIEVARQPSGLTVSVTLLDEFGKVYSSRESTFQGEAWEHEAHGALSALGPWREA